MVEFNHNSKVPLRSWTFKIAFGQKPTKLNGKRVRRYHPDGLDPKLQKVIQCEHLANGLDGMPKQEVCVVVYMTGSD